MKISNLQNGSLYFNLKKRRVERVRSKMNSSSVMTSEPHSDTLIATKAENLRIATKGEVDVYVKESEELCR